MSEDDQANDRTFVHSITEEEEAASFSIPAPSVNGYIGHITRAGLRLTFAEWPHVINKRGSEYIRSAITLSLADAAYLHLMLGEWLKPHPEAMDEARTWAKAKKDAE